MQTLTFGAESSAVPAFVKTALEKEHDLFKNCFELDVRTTIDKDLEQELREY